MSFLTVCSILSQVYFSSCFLRLPVSCFTLCMHFISMSQFLFQVVHLLTVTYSNPIKFLSVYMFVASLFKLFIHLFPNLLVDGDAYCYSQSSTAALCNLIYSFHTFYMQFYIFFREKNHIVFMEPNFTSIIIIIIITC